MNRPNSMPGPIPPVVNPPLRITTSEAGEAREARNSGETGAAVPALKIIQSIAWGLCGLFLLSGWASFMNASNVLQQAASGTIVLCGYVLGRTVEKVCCIWSRR